MVPSSAATGARGEGDGAEQRGAKRGEASTAQRGAGAKAAAAAEAKADVQGEVMVLSSAAPSEARRAWRSESRQSRRIRQSGGRYARRGR